ARRDLDILPSMLKANTITQAQYEEALATPVTPQITPVSTGCSTANSIGAGFFCDYVGRVIANNALLGTDESGAPKSLSRGGYDIFTTLDVDLQTAAHAKLDAHVPRSSNVLDLGASLVTVEPGTGRILAMAQNKEYNADPGAATPESTAVNYGTAFVDGGSTGFQVGSTYKIFTLAEWLKQGNALNDRINGNQRAWDLSTFKDSCLGSGTGTYTPKNDGGSNPGTTTVLSATASSVNNAYLGMAQRLDQCEIRKTAEAFGVARADGQPLTSYVSDVLGTNEIAPLNMAAAFAAVANEGVYCAPVAISRIVDAAGSELALPPAACAPAVSPQVAATMAYALTSVVTNGTATASNPRNGIPHFGKTGTTDSEKDTWFVGSTTNLTTAVWVGNVVGDVSLRNSSIDGTNGASLRHVVWKDYMSAADGKYGGEAFPAPDRSLLQGVQVRIPSVTGQSIDSARAAIEAAGFGFEDGGTVASDQRAGTVARTNPSGSASRGAVVTVYTSDGSGVQQPQPTRGPIVPVPTANPLAVLPPG
ncbi:penicillin-binding protein, partial [Subtercola sp. Z020]|uniref:penicillin-binding protein n=1 Tax=Subtercola sp. Z020 TaxID=2080582 RepID=UPI000D42D87E